MKINYKLVVYILIMTHLTFKKCLALLFFLIIFTHYSAHAQFGNEWINRSQKYVKIKISAEGLYSVTYNQIVQAGFTSNSIDPKKFQLFTKGKQVPLIISGNQNTFETTDNVRFYGQTNDASLDKILYQNATDLPNNEVSLYEDANYYFLTYSETVNGLRYQNKTISNNGLTPESYIVANSRLNLSSNYYPGAYIFDVITYSEYIAGEGYLGATYGRGQTATYNLNTPSFAPSTNFETTASFYVAGRSASNSGNRRGNHHLKVTANNITVADTTFFNYNVIRQQKKIALGNLPAVSIINFSSVDDLTTNVNFTDFQAPSYIEINYPRLVNLSGLNNLKFNLNTTNINSYLRFANSNIGNAIILDNSTNTLYTEIKSSGNAEFVIEAKPNVTYYLADLDTTSPVITEPVTFKNYTTNDVKPYLIITNKNFIAGAEAYKTYNETRNLPTMLTYTDDLYNEFYYGYHHPLAIKNFVSWGLLVNGDAKPKYMLLLGNGAEFTKTNMAIDFVPTIGFPPSDNMLTSGLNGSLLEPGIITGRVPAINNQDIENYLSKLKIYNQLPDSLWRKNFLHISGGKTVNENESFVFYHQNFFENAKKESFGGKVSNIKKNINTPITENQTERVIRETNNGLGLISYFGHGSTTATEISFGEAKNYDNKNKPTIYIVNGCSTGNIFNFSISQAEQFIMQKDYGGVAWIANTSEGVGSELYSATMAFYRNWFKESYGESISSGFKKGLKTYQNPNRPLNVAHTRQYIFIGDPAITFYSPTKADYETKNSFLYATVNNQNSSLPTLSLKLKIENPGKALSDSVVVKVTRTLADNSIIQIPDFKIKPVYNTDTISINLSNEGIIASGNNKITVILDPNNNINELNENNNQATLDIFLPGNGINLLYPINKGIVSKSTVSLEAQPDDLYTKNAEYYFEIDTLITFNSNFVKKSPIIAAGLLPKWIPNFTFETGKVYYWRARINAPLDKGGAWSTASFTYLPNTADGISISQTSQLQNLSLNNIVFDNITGKFSFSTSLYLTNIQTRGDDLSTASERRLRVNPNSQIAFRPEFNGISLVSLHPKNFGQIFSYPSPYNFQAGPNLINGYSGQYFWDITNPVEVDSLLSYLRQIPTGHYVIGLNGYNAAINLLPTVVKNELSNIGLANFNLINLGEPYAFWGQKGSSPGSATEITADYTSAIPARSQLISFAKAYTYNANNGNIVTEKIGPAKTWKTAQFDFNKKGADIVTYSIIGVGANGQETTILQNITTNEVDISTISTVTYPYLKIRSSILDNVDFDVPDIKYWRILYQPVAELTFNPEFKDIFKSSTVQEGDSVLWEIGITNLSDYESDAMNISATILKADKNTVTKPVINLPKIAPRTSTTINFKDATKGMGGKNNLKLQFQTRNELELYPFNNILPKEYLVNKDFKEPLVDVVFDGKNIINGEIVSPQPIISITTIDENKFLLFSDLDTILTDVYIKKQDENKFIRLYYSTNELKIKPSTSSGVNKLNVQYITNTPFEDGIYSLKVRSKDASGNYNTANDYTIEFECINKSEISNFYPYPNPFTTSMRFVFTLTGMKIPDDIKITLFTATGKVIREVFKNELGNIRIGNNISDFTWDGTDQYGDRLANGVYFYRVTLKNYDDAQIGRRKTEGDTLFKKDIGKIYLMR